MKRKSFLKLLSLSPIALAMTNLKDLGKLSATFSDTPLMPVLFLGHGSPMNAIEENEFVTGFRNIEKTLPKPNAILCISAHWFTNGIKVTAMEMPKTIHDFGGFPDELFQVQYPANGSPLLAETTKTLLSPHSVALDQTWGLDHGAWSVIKHLYPNADVPVIQLSMDYTKDIQFHFDLAKQLQALRSKGVLIIGSGNIIHNLGLVDFRNFNKDNYGYDWAIEARSKVNQYLLDGNFKPLINFQNEGKALQLAVPTPEHYLPLIYALGLKQNNEDLSLFNDKFVAGSLSMTSVKIG
jgi:4,5-DOPA dioxygenase extradiol